MEYKQEANMEKTNITEIITKYFKAVCDAYSLGNVESSYNAPIMALFTDIGCAAPEFATFSILASKKMSKIQP